MDDKNQHASAKKTTVMLSRGALEEARVALEFKQATIAFRILEKHPTLYDNPPHKLVWRAFNGRNIQLDKAELVAQALQVPLAQLLARPVHGANDGEDTEAVAAAPPLAEGGTATRAERSARREAAAGAADAPGGALATDRRGSAWLAAAAAVFVVAAVVVGLRVSVPSASTDAPKLPGLESLVIVADGDVPTRFADAMRISLGERLRDARFITAGKGMPGIEDFPQLVAFAGGGPVLHIGHRPKGFHALLEFTLATHSASQRIWYATARSSALDAEVAQRVAAGVAEALDAGDGEARPSVAAGTRQVQAMESYLNARRALDLEPEGDANALRRVFQLAQAAVDRDGAFALAHAVKCEALARLYWTDSDQSFLPDANTACDTAGELAPDNPYVAAARAQLLIREERPHAAVALVEPMLAKHPEHVDLLLAAARGKFSLGYKGAEGALPRAVEHAEAVTALEPEFYVGHFWAGTYSYFAGDRSGAIPHLQRAADINPQPVVLNNLAALLTCAGDLTGAEETSRTLMTLDPSSPLGPESLGKVLGLRHQHTQEVHFRELALSLYGDASPDIYEVYALLGDAYRRAGRAADAAGAYERALQTVLRDRARASDDSSLMVAHAMLLGRIASTQMPSPSEMADTMVQMRSLLEQADMTSLATSGQVQVAQSYGLLGEETLAEHHWRAASAGCAAYEAHPDRNSLDTLPGLQAAN
ncbi:MAG: hypothetical protein AAGA68_22475 [Pseudomonadota bacterium]